jgi:hypothetical protein
MMKKLKILLLLLLSGMGANAQSTCSDLNQYPVMKNSGAVGAYTLRTGYEEKAAQTYFYSGPGSVSQIRIYGALLTGSSITLNALIYNVDANNRPTSVIKSVPLTWYSVMNSQGYFDVNMGNVIVNSNFAIGVEISGGTSPYRSFSVGYTGDGEGHGEDLASLAGTSTGYNWSSAKSNFSKDGDFYLLPKMNNYITSGFLMNKKCAAVNSTISFTNTSDVSMDSMFNKLGNPKYSGSNYEYAWDFGDNSAVSHSTNPQHSYAKAGMYTIALTVTFEGWGNTCTDVFQKTVSVGLAVSATKIVNVNCNGSYSGSVTASATGGIPSYKYSIDGDNYYTTALFSNMRAGQYTLYVQDSFQCSATAGFSITQPGQIVPLTWGSSNSTCGKSNGSVSLVATGGTGSLKYSLDGGAFQSSGNFSSLPAGHKIITIKDSMNCTSIFTIDVNDASGPVLKVTSYNNISCNSTHDGAITLASTGGSGAPQYSIDGQTFNSTGIFSNLGPGTYGAMVKDANGCIDIITITLKEPTALLFSTSTTNATCHSGFDGTITVLNARGGSGAYSYSIDGKTFQSNTTFQGLKAGQYSVYLRDAASCTAMVITTVNEPDQLTASVSVVNPTCNGSNDGMINVSVTGGTKPYAFSTDGTHFQPVGTFTGMSAGTYAILIRDANGCFYLATSAVITQPTAIKASITTTNATCGNGNGQILAQASGGSGTGYKYTIDGGKTFNTTGSFSNLKDSTYTLMIVDSKTCPAAFIVNISSTNGPQLTTVNHTNVSCNGGFDGSIAIGNVSGGTGNLEYSIDGFVWQTSKNFSGLPAGSYIVRVKDAVGCTGVAGITITEPQPIVIVTSPVDPSCYFAATGSVTVYAAGGNGTMAYSIDGIYYQSSNVFTKLSAGYYNVYVRDAGHCSAVSNFTLTDPPQILIMSTGILNVTCNGANNGAITVYATGGKGLLAYSLDGATFQSSNKFSGLNGGLHTVFVKDANNCIVQEFAMITEPSSLNAIPEINQVSCTGGNNGAIILNPYGGTLPYTYQWSTFETTKDLLNLKAGIYSVTVTDAHGCTFTATYTIIQPAKAMVVNGAVEDAHVGMNDGSIKLTITGGTGFYNFTWSNGATGQEISDLAPGKYTVIVNDANNCQVSATFSVGINTAIAPTNSENLNVKMFPNPADMLVYIDAGSKIVQQVTIMTIDGKIVSDVLINEAKPRIDTRMLSNGIYIVGYKIDGVNYRQRLEIQR